MCVSVLSTFQNIIRPVFQRMKSKQKVLAKIWEGSLEIVCIISVNLRILKFFLIIKLDNMLSESLQWYRATSLVKTFASNIRKLFLLKISLFLYIPSVILISKCCSAFPELAVIVLNWERSMLTLSFLCSHMCLLWKWISSQFGWTHDNDTKTFITIWAFLFYLTSIMLSSCSVHQLYTFFKIFCHTNYCQKVFSTTFVEIKSASYPFLRMDVRLFLCFNPVLGKIS